MAVESARASRRRLIAIVVALAVAVAAVVGLFVYTSSQQSTPTSTTNVKVVVAVAAIERGTQIGAASVTLADRPADQIPADALKDTTTAVGQYAALTISPQSILTAASVVASPAQITTQAKLPIPDNYVALSIPNDEQKGVGGYITVGDHIDMIADISGAGTVRYVFQDVPIAAVGAPGGGGSLLIVIVPRAQAEELSWLVSGRGSTAVILKYVLRNSNQSYKFGGKGSPAPTPRYLDSGNILPYGTPPNDPPITEQQWAAIFPAA